MQVVVGRIKRPHGVRGDLLLEVRTDDPGRRFAAGAELATDPPGHGPLTVSSSRPHSGQMIVTFAEVPDRTAAEDLRGTWLVLDSSELGPTGDPDEFHDHELIGLAAVGTGGEPLGVVADVRHHGQDLLVIEREGDEELLVPFVTAIVPEVDVAAGRLVIDPPPGLLDP
jgi:16S rRNA processing protein RimM